MMKLCKKGLNPEDKSERVFHYATNLINEVSFLVHSCGLDEPRSLNRSYVEIINQLGQPTPLTTIYPDVETRQEYAD